jgi:hypothetical protein
VSAAALINHLRSFAFLFGAEARDALLDESSASVSTEPKPHKKIFVLRLEAPHHRCPRTI